MFSISTNGNQFKIFSTEHLLTLFLFLLGGVCLYLFRNRLNDKIIRWVFFLVLFLFEATYHIWLALTHMWDISVYLPLQLCSISLILCLVLLATNRKAVFEIVYFTGIAGAIQAIVTPDLDYNFPHFRFFEFFLTHIFIIYTCLYYVWSVGYKPTILSFFKSFIFLNVSAVFDLLVNKLTKGNYMFLSHKPLHGSALDFLGPYPWYILSLEGVALLLFFILLLPFFHYKKQKENMSA